MRRRTLPGDNGGITALYRTVVLTLLAGVAVVAVALANRNVYTKPEIDTKIQSVQQHSTDLHRLEDERHRIIERDIQDIKQDVRWIVRQMGGEVADTQEGDHSP